MSVNAAKYRQRVTIMQPVDTPNSSGGSARTYSNLLVNEPANFTYAPPAKKGDEVFTQQQIRSSVFATVAMRYRASVNISAAMRVVFGSRTFEIRTVLVPDEYPQEIVLQCEELQGKGSTH